MNQRERLLAIAVGGLFAALLITWGLGKYRTALSFRQQALTAQRDQQKQIHEQLVNGEYANRYMGEYLVRSLPPNPERAKSIYKQWLLETIESNELVAANVSANRSRLIGGLYQRMEFRVNGQTDIPNFVELLHDFYAKDYLHRIRDFSLTPMKEGNFKVELSIDVIALLAAPNELPPRDRSSWKIDRNVAAYHDKILNRTLFEPPNQAPKYSGQSVVQSVVGSDAPSPLTFEDPEGHSIRYEFIEPPPDFVELDHANGTLQINTDDKQEFTILLRAIDGGYPSQSTEQTLTIKIIDPPPEPEPPAAKPDFDDANQTVLSGLVQGDGQWTAWLHVRTRGKTLKLRSGDQFEIGSLHGTALDVTPKHVVLKIDDREFKLLHGGNLGATVNKPNEE